MENQEMKNENLIGRKFGKLFILGEDKKSRAQDTIFVCKCSCGELAYIPKRIITRRIEAGTEYTLCCSKCENSEIINHTFGDYYVIEEDLETSKRFRTSFFKCKCVNCGKIIPKSKSDLFLNKKLTCQNCHNSRKVNIDDYLNKMFGKLEVLEYDEEKSKTAHKTIFKCKCHGSCGGNIVYVSASGLKNGTSTTCGCSRSGIDSKRVVPMINKTFNGLTVIEVDEEKMNEIRTKVEDYNREHPESTKAYPRNFWYKCRCGNGHITSHNGTSLRAGTEYCKYCYPYGKNFEDLTGRAFGRLKVEGIDYEKTKGKIVYWKCGCYREGETIPHAHVSIPSKQLLSGNNRSCGCLFKDTLELQRKYDPDVVKKLQGKYNTLTDRCFNEDSDLYYRYGERGITSEYSSFEEFYNDNYDKYKDAVKMYGNSVEIDRIDNDGNYEPGNIRFVPRSANDVNRESNTYFEYGNQLWTISMIKNLCNYYGNTNITESMIRDRLVNRNWTVADVIFNNNRHDTRLITKPIFNTNDIELLHKTSQGLHPDDIDYTYYKGSDNITPEDKKRIIQENKDANYRNNN